MHITRRRAMLAPIAGLVLLASACSGGSGGGKGGVQVTLQDFAVKLSKSTVPAGEITFAATNEGPSVHELEIFSVPEGIDPDDLPVKDNVADTESQGLDAIDEVEDVAPSTTTSLTLSLEPGTYVLICNLAGHYEQGMHAALTVE